ncbi:MAG: hypothetical protein KME60_07095 [Cyanomargarita calcarea GSE-NOS-MK-12-04C]|jgi:hypothetical protein|uniref:Uncharacterized protein n=1 Tax=Cyanomargarita calcarea GSE-NOS-MK-12-04C TaxID=2839659 RepID=A0A951UTX9_9CYAN|nr:hypothetical protein [Cyanomargarita calcarea GSE-NOS-MK-12-04C]
MGLADIVAEALESEQVRNIIGTRVLNLADASQENESGGIGGFVSWLWDGAKALAGFLCEKIGSLLNFTISSFWSFLHSTAQFLWNFNWNMSDKQIDEQIRSKWDALGSMLGGTVGNFIGYLGCGAVPGAVILAFNEPLGAYVLANVTEELAEEFIGNLSALIKYTFTAGTQALMISSYKDARKFIKKNEKFARAVLGSKVGDLIKAWGTENSKPWSFAQTLEDAVEEIPNTFVRNFVEEFLEEAWEGCIEAGYVVANSVDTFLAGEKFKQQQTPQMGKTKFVEIQPDRSIEDQRIVLAGPQELLKPHIVSTLANYQLMREKDIGTVHCFEPEKARSRRFKPHVVLHFQETKEDFNNRSKTDSKASRGKGIISFRLMNETSESLTIDYVTQLANKIKSKFGNPPYEWNKGKLLFSYTDYDKGYQLQLLTSSESEALRVIESVLDLKGDSVDREKIQEAKNLLPEKAYDDTPRKKIILGKPEEQPVRRKPCKVKFLYAQLFVEDKQDPVTLYDRSKRYRNPLVRDITE